MTIDLGNLFMFLLAILVGAVGWFARQMFQRQRSDLDQLRTDIGNKLVDMDRHYRHEIRAIHATQKETPRLLMMLFRASERLRIQDRIALEREYEDPDKWGDIESEENL